MNRETKQSLETHSSNTMNIKERNMIVLAHLSRTLIGQLVDQIGQPIDVIDQQVSQLVNEAVLAYESDTLAKG